MKKAKKYPHLRRARIGICPICNKEFRAVKDFKEYKQNFCSRECWSHRAQIKYICEGCGKIFYARKKENRKYCSRECALKYMNGKKAGRFKDGKSLERDRARLAKEVREWRKAIFKRDIYTCQECGAKGKLHAHHIKLWADYPKLRFDIDNGVTLCEQCHGRLHNKDFSTRRIKICPTCGKATKGRGKTSLCRSCAIRQSWLFRNPTINSHVPILSEKTVRNGAN